ncbi:hypothetical protein AVEN_31550-1 [Araneus ventricosus]|uniref:Uncharacterized protein n=1 Tax=Araneus ventricosus TaxID=182803 RepID=A0A4Y2WFW6_ARAVE|nr:hypothetical protein AVEN_31550-1 [Araneus ventricosus]
MPKEKEELHRMLPMGGKSNYEAMKGEVAETHEERNSLFSTSNKRLACLQGEEAYCFQNSWPNLSGPLIYTQLKQETSLIIWGRGGLVVGPRPWGRRAPDSKPDSTEDPPYMGPVAHQIIRSGQTSSRWCFVEALRRGASSGVILVI